MISLMDTFIKVEKGQILSSLTLDLLHTNFQDFLQMFAEVGTIHFKKATMAKAPCLDAVVSTTFTAGLKMTTSL